MLGLAEQVGRDIGRICGVIRDDQDLGRACDHVDVDRAERELFRRRNKGVARADDLVDLRDEACAVGQRCDGLCAADGDDLVHTCDLRRREHLIP